MSHQWRDRLVTGRTRTWRSEAAVATALALAALLASLALGGYSPFRRLLQSIIF